MMGTLDRYTRLESGNYSSPGGLKVRYVPNWNCFADAIDRLIVTTLKLAHFENAKRVEQGKINPNSELIAQMDNASRDCCEHRNILKREIDRLLSEIVKSGEYNPLTDPRTFRAPNKTFSDLLEEQCELGARLAEKLNENMS